MIATTFGELPQDHFCNGRLFATVAAHGGIIDLSYWGRQHLAAAHFFRGEISTAWNKLFRPALVVGDKRYYPVLGKTRLFPFGLSSQGQVEKITFQYELLLLPDSLVQRVVVLDNPGNHKIGLEVLHQEAVTAVQIPGRVWSDFVFSKEWNALMASCADQKEPEKVDALAQSGFDVSSRDLNSSTTWVAVSSEAPLSARRGYHARSKHYLKSAPAKGTRIACHVVFATEKAGLERRLQQLSSGVHAECDALLRDYEKRQAERPCIRTGAAVLDSAFGQYPAIIDCLKITDRPGAVRATASGYFVWGWDGMMPLFSSTLANDAAHAAEVLRFFHQTRDSAIGLPHTFTTAFIAYAKGPFPAQAQYLAGLYLYVALTGDLALAREVWPTCRFILDRCRENEAGGSGLAGGNALWPDFPEAMEETGEDISSMNNSLLYQGLRGMEYLAAALGDAALAAECSDWAGRLRRNFIKYLFDEDKGYFISSCSSRDFRPRRHYCAQAVFWLTPFAGELVSHAPHRIAGFMDDHLRSAKCLLTLPHWDTAWMADGNQLGSSFPAADLFYLGVHRMIGDDSGLKTWLGDVEWFWRHHTAPEAFTPEAENEHEMGPDNTGTKQLQALAAWYASAYHALAGLDFDHEGITLTPWGSHPLEIQGMKLRGVTLDLKISGAGRHLGLLSLNGRPLPAGSHKIAWEDLDQGQVCLEWSRTESGPDHPVIVRADGLRVLVRECAHNHLVALVSGSMAGEVVVRANPAARVSLAGNPVASAFDLQTETHRISVPVTTGVTLKIFVP